MADKIKSFVPAPPKTLEELIDTYKDSEFISEMGLLYKNVRDHLKVCEFMAREQFGKEDVNEFTLEVSRIVRDFMELPSFEVEAESSETVNAVGETEVPMGFSPRDDYFYPEFPVPEPTE